MKTTIDIQDELLARAKLHARQNGRPLRAVVEEGCGWHWRRRAPGFV
ncbi:MAG: hypothetical protein J4G13_13075 [Dehalococcoidia bacterium]|nr:hypothetical protein [Dehalococcoidia bacterium]